MIKDIYLPADLHVVWNKTLVKYNAGSFSHCFLFPDSWWQCLKWVYICCIIPFVTKTFWQRRGGNTGWFYKYSLLCWASPDYSDLWDAIFGKNTYQSRVHYLVSINTSDVYKANLLQLISFQIPSTHTLPTSCITEQTLC